jgi:hypothetical protein
MRVFNSYAVGIFRNATEQRHMVGPHTFDADEVVRALALSAGLLSSGIR